MTVRWKFHDTNGGDEIVLPINPKSMGSPHEGPRETATASGTGAGFGRLRVFDRGVTRPVEWTFDGVILTREHDDLLLAWTKRFSVLRVTDHLDRTFEIIVKSYDSVERLPTANRPWRADYTMTCLMLKEVV